MIFVGVTQVVQSMPSILFHGTRFITSIDCRPTSRVSNCWISFHEEYHLPATIQLQFDETKPIPQYEKFALRPSATQC